MGLVSAFRKLKTSHAHPASPAVGNGPLTRKQFMQNSAHFGVNLGSLFVLEKWIAGSLFGDNANGDSELAALQAHRQRGESLSEMREQWEKHWTTFVTNEDLEWLKHNGVTAVRLPIGFWNVGGAKFVKGTPFEEFAQVYQNSWKVILDLIQAADKHDLGVLLDFHALPGGCNPDAHSGTNSGKAEFWNHKSLRSLALEAYAYAANDLKGYENLVGIEVVNEVPWNVPHLKEFYLDAIDAIRQSDAGVPVYISDGWNLDGWRSTIKELDGSLGPGESIGVVIDTHMYMVSKQDQSAAEIVDWSKSCVAPDPDVDAIVGEFSSCLSEESWNRGPQDRRQELESEFCKKQFECYSRTTRSGVYFWTYKFEAGYGGSWDFREMVGRGALKPREVPNGDPNALGSKLSSALEQHKSYWQGVDSRVDWEHFRFEAGFTAGYKDAAAFASVGACIGRLAAVRHARLAQHLKSSNKSDKLWVFEQAYNQGVDAF